MTDSPKSLSNQPTMQTALHVGMCLFVAAQWIITYVLMVTPNNKLHAMGFGNAIAVDVTYGILFAFIVAVVSLKKRRTCPSIVLFFATQILAWGHSVGLIIFFVFAAIYALRHGA